MKAIRRKTAFLSAFLLLLAGTYWFYFVRREPFPAIVKSAPNAKGIVEGEFSFRCNLPCNRRTLVRYKIPFDRQTGQPLPSASRMVFYAPYNGDAPRLRKGLPAWLDFFPEKAGYSVFSLVIETRPGMALDTKRYYVYEEAGWYELFFAIQKHLEEAFGLRNASLYIVGESSGGSLAERLVAKWPERIAAAAWNGGTSYARLPKSACTVPMLALHTDGCYAIPATMALKQQCEEDGIPLFVGTIPRQDEKADFHAAQPLAYQMMQLFVVDREKFLELWDAHPEVHGLHD